MLQNFKDKPKIIRLDKHIGLPPLRLLEEICTKTMANANSTYELPFGDDTLTHILTVKREMTKGSWMWMFYRNNGFGTALEWSQFSHDADHILRLISTSNPELGRKRPTSTMPELPEPAAAAPAVQQTGTFSGSLKNVQVSTLMQSINIGRMTGMLELLSPQDKACVYFLDGQPFHAVMRAAQGHEAIVQMASWNEGTFAFNEGHNTDIPHTVTRGLIGLLMEGATYCDYLEYLKKAGLTASSTLVQSKKFSSFEEFAAALKDGVEADLSLQQYIYEKADGRSSWALITRDLTNPKSELTTALFNLMNCGVIGVSTTGNNLANRLRKAALVDWSAVQSIEQLLSRGETGFYTQAALWYFVRQEYFRYQAARTPFSFILFGVKNLSSGEFVALSSPAMAELKRGISGVKRDLDLICHHGAFAYAMLLPGADKDSALKTVDLIAEIVAPIKMADQYSSSQFAFSATVASMPADGMTLEEMLGTIRQGGSE